MDHYRNILDVYDQAVKEKTRNISASDLEDPQCAEHLDYLLHSVKSLKTIIAMDEASEGGSYGRGYRDGGYRNGGYRDGNGGGYTDGGYGDGGNRGGYGARGRGRNASRDSMGRYTHGDEREEFISRLEELMETAPNEQMRSAAKQALHEAQRV